jgi:hypothetical protein
METSLLKVSKFLQKYQNKLKNYQKIGNFNNIPRQLFFG